MPITIKNNWNKRCVRELSRERVLRYVRESLYGTSITEASRALGISQTTVSKQLSILHAMGLVGLKYIGNVKLYFPSN